MTNDRFRYLLINLNLTVGPQTQGLTSKTVMALFRSWSKMGMTTAKRRKKKHSLKKTWYGERKCSFHVLVPLLFVLSPCSNTNRTMQHA